MKKHREETDIPAHFFVPGMSGMDRISCTDPFGSYTGLVNDPEEKPIQDADDL